MKQLLTLLLLSLLAQAVGAVELESLPGDPYFEPFKPIKIPVREGAVIQKGDSLAICGDSITEQKMYSRIMETYLTVCVPQLEVTVRQFGWSGERAPGFYARMANDVQRFKPTLATTCYGMNDHLYRSYTEEIGRVYRDNALAIIKDFKRQGVRVIQGSAGTVGKMPSWVRTAQGTVLDLNLGLLELRNIDVQLAEQEQVSFADVYLPMLVQGFYAKQKYGEDYMISGKDGVHPGWAGQLVMAYAFLEAMGLEGEIARIEWDADTQKVTVSQGHRVLSVKDNIVTFKSHAYPFCATGPLDNDGSVRSGMTLVPFNERLNRFILMVRNLSSGKYKVSWGDTVRTYTAEALARGVNLAADYEVNPFSEAFQRVDNAVGKKQEYETRQVKTLFHGPEGRVNMDATVELTEETRAPLVQAVRDAFKPVEHSIQIKAF
ncbi:MAG: hypothetical protein K9N55_13900 [Phycisphaerae bacterium]|nr:hypothetical protein [Phycisphaerae bacterium]